MRSLAAVNYNTAANNRTIFPVVGFVKLPAGRGVVANRDSFGNAKAANGAYLFSFSGLFAGCGLGHYPIAVGMLFKLGSHIAGADLANLPMAACITLILDKHMLMLFAFVFFVPMIFPLVAVNAHAVVAAGIEAALLAALLAHTAVGADSAAFRAGAAAVIANGGAAFTHAAVFAHDPTVIAEFTAFAAQISAVFATLAAIAAAVF